MIQAMLLDDDFAFLVLEIVADIPKGNVATYGLLAHLAGYPKHSRLVAKVLSNANRYGRYPCHRVVNAVGRPAPNWEMQKTYLIEEGVRFTASGNVILKDHLWNP